MLRLAALRSKPHAFVRLTGLMPAELDTLLTDFEPAYQRHRAATPTTRRGHKPRRRAAGAGHPHALDLPQRLLLALVWLKI